MSCALCACKRILCLCVLIVVVVLLCVCCVVFVGVCWVICHSKYTTCYDCLSYTVFNNRTVFVMLCLLTVFVCVY